MASLQNLTKKEATANLRKIYKVFREKRVHIKLNRRLRCAGEVTFGHWNSSRVDIAVDPNDNEFVSTLIHEALHIVYPDMEEAGIRHFETQMMKLLTDRQLTNLLKRFMSTLQ